MRLNHKISSLQKMLLCLINNNNLFHYLEWKIKGSKLQHEGISSIKYNEAFPHS